MPLPAGRPSRARCAWRERWLELTPTRAFRIGGEPFLVPPPPDRAPAREAERAECWSGRRRRREAERPTAQDEFCHLSNERAKPLNAILGCATILEPGHGRGVRCARRTIERNAPAETLSRTYSTIGVGGAAADRPPPRIPPRSWSPRWNRCARPRRTQRSAARLRFATAGRRGGRGANDAIRSCQTCSPMPKSRHRAARCRCAGRARRVRRRVRTGGGNRERFCTRIRAITPGGQLDHAPARRARAGAGIVRTWSSDGGRVGEDSPGRGRAPRSRCGPSAPPALAVAASPPETAGRTGAVSPRAPAKARPRCTAVVEDEPAPGMVATICATAARS